MSTVSLDDLRQRFYDLMDEGQGQNYVKPPLANQFINNAVSSLYHIIVDLDPWRIYKEYYFTPIVGESDLTLPDDFLRALKVYAQPVQNTSLRFIPMQRYNASDFTMFNNSVRFAFLPNPVPRYRIMGNVIKLDPAPQQSPVGYNVALWYTPQAPVLLTSDPYNLFTGITGHEQWIVNQAVIYAKTKEEVPYGDVAALNAQILEQIKRDISFRDRGTNDMLLDTEGLLCSIPGNDLWH